MFIDIGTIDTLGPASSLTDDERLQRIPRGSFISTILEGCATEREVFTGVPCRTLRARIRMFRLPGHLHREYLRPLSFSLRSQIHLSAELLETCCIYSSHLYAGPYMQGMRRCRVRSFAHCHASTNADASTEQSLPPRPKISCLNYQLALNLKRYSAMSRHQLVAAVEYFQSNARTESRRLTWMKYS